MIIFVVLPLFFSLGICSVYDQVIDLRQTTFDFVIVGGGTAGAVLANRLSADERFQVLVIEAGLSNEGVVNSQCPYLWRALQNTQYDWNFTSTPQKALNGRTNKYFSGHILGGTSAGNGMDYTRGSADDYDRWARITGDPGWSWDQLLPYFKKSERWSFQTEPRNTTGQFNPAVHGFNGKTLVSLYGEPQAIDPRVIAAANELGDGFKYNLDMNSGYPLGTGWLQSTIGHGERSSSATAYLSPDVLKRTNLHVLLNTRATRLVNSNDSDQGRRVFRRIELLSNSGSSTTVQAIKEVILSAGTVGSPRILMHSGIGDANELESVGIKSLVDLPSVGKNLTDQPFVFVSFRANTTLATTLDNLATNATAYAEAFNLWKTERKGPMAIDGTDNFIWLRLPLQNNPDPSAGPNTPHLQLFVQNGGSVNEPRVSLGVVIVTPASRGTLKLTSSKPFGPLLLDPGTLTAPIDLILVREGIRTARKFFSAHAWDGYVLDEAYPTAGATTDEELDAVIRENAEGFQHTAGTAAMSAQDATYGVVNPDLKVKKVEGLRVVDASVMPFIIAGHTSAPVYAIAERASDLILREWAR